MRTTSSADQAGQPGVPKRGAKTAKRHQAGPLDRWYRLRSYLDSAATHGITALDAISSAIAGKLWLPPLPAVS